MSQLAIKQALQIAIERHRAGKLQEAESICRKILEAQPNNPEALHLLGVIASQVGRLDAAADLMRQAIAAAPDMPIYYCDLGTVLKLRGEIGGAVACYERALALRSDFPEAYFNLGVVMSDKGQIDQAITCYQRALALKSDYADAHYNLGNAWMEKGDLDQAIGCFERVVALRPDDPDAHNNLGNTLKGKGQVKKAIVCYQRALTFKPKSPELHNNLGVALREGGHPEQAIASFERAIALKPAFFEAIRNLGMACKDNGQPDQAIAWYRRALELKAEDAELHNALGVAWREKGQPDQAIECHRRALSLSPGMAEAHSDLGGALKDRGQMEEAVGCYRRALEINPQYVTAHSNLLFAMHYQPGCTSQNLLAESRRWNDQHAVPLKRFIHNPSARSEKPRLRIGYVSPDFCRHVQAFFTVPLLENHDRRRFEIYCYSSASTPDSMTERLRRSADVWREVFGLGDEQLATQIKEDGIDILVDLTMHMAHNRLPVFARKPAPLQVTWLAYPGTTGLDAIDYRLTDPYLDPPGDNDADYSERSVQLPRTFWCYDPLSDEPAVNALPCLEGRGVTFGCLNNFSKVNDGVLALWAKVLTSVPRSRLILSAPEGSCRERVLDRLGEAGVGSERVEFVAKRPRTEYLRTNHRIDIALDTFPYNGHTTSLDSYWMGVPVMALAGQTVVGRAGASQLTNLGLVELIARSPEEFVRKSVDLAGDMPRLADLRSNLRQRMRNSPLMDAAGFTRGIEETYRNLGQQWCAKS